MQYIIVLTAEGKIKAQYAVGAHRETIEELRDYVKAQHPDEPSLECESQVWAELQKERAYWDIEKQQITYEPEKVLTAEEQKADALNKLDAEAKTIIADYDSRIIKAETVDKDAEYAEELRQERLKYIEEYANKRGAL